MTKSTTALLSRLTLSIPIADAELPRYIACMNKHNAGFLAATVLAGVLCCDVALAQEVEPAPDSAHPNGTQVGLGAGLNLGGPRTTSDAVGTLPFAGGSIMLPIDLGGSFRVEPELLFQHHRERGISDIGTFMFRDVTVLQPAVGLFGRLAPVRDVAVNLGARLGGTVVLIAEAEDTHFISVAPAAAAEYFVNSRFSVSVEAQLSFLFPLRANASAEPFELSVGTNALLAARVFFFDCEAAGVK